MNQYDQAKIFTEIDSCRICDSNDLHEVLNLGEQPPANTLRRELKDILPVAPLKLVHCANCLTVQLTTTVEPDYLFSHYVWVTATSATARSYSEIFCSEVLKRTKKSLPFVVEIASNDGTFLKKFQERECSVLGIDPAQNIAQKAAENGIPTVADFFNVNIARKLLKDHGHPGVVIARNVIPHVKEIHSIVEGLSELVDASGVVAIEFHYTKKIIDELHYDSIYHEHLFYFSIKSIEGLFNKYGFYSFDVFSSPISGGSLVLFFSKNKIKKTEDLEQMINSEDALCLNTLPKWKDFGEKSVAHSKNLKEIVDKYASKGALVAYGASARSSTMMNFSRITKHQIDYVIDKNPLKQGLYTPGTDIPIVSYEDGIKDLSGKNMLLLAWNFEKEVVQDLRSSGFKGDIIVPLPTIHIV
jgi:hypothetical protein